MHQGGSIKIAHMDVGGRATQGAVAESSQIFPEFVQAQGAAFVQYAGLCLYRIV